MFTIVVEKEMTIEIELIFLTRLGLETELIVENDCIEIIGIEIMNERLFTQIPEKGILLYIQIYIYNIIFFL